MTQDLFYYESGYIDDSYFVYTADAAASVASESTMTAAVGVIKNSSANLNSEFAQTVTISNVQGADLFAFTEAQLAAQVSLIRDNNIQSSAQFSIAIDAVRGIYVSAQADSAFDVAVVNLRVRNEKAAASAAFSMTTNADVIDGGQVVEAQGNWSSSSDLTTIAERIQQAIASIDSTTSLVIPGERILEGASVENAAFSPSLTVEVIKNSFAVLDSVSTVVAQAIITRDLASTINSASSLTATAIKVYNLSSTIAASSSLSSGGSFRNKHPFTVYERYGSTTQPATSFFLSSVEKYYGTGSAYTPGSNTSTNTNFWLEVGQANTSWAFAANENFYISFYVKIPTALVGSTSHVKLLSTNSGWDIGYYGSSAVPYFRSEAGTLTVSPFGSHSVWQRWIVKRVSGVITLTIIGSSTWSNSVSYSGAIAGSGQLYFNRNDSTGKDIEAYFDEVYVAKGVTAPQFSYPSGEINDGALDSTRLLLHFNGNFVDDSSGIKVGSAALASAATLQAQADNRLRDQSAALSSEGFVQTTVGRIRPFASLEDTQFNLAANVGVIKPAASEQASAFAVTADATKQFGPFEITCASSSSATATGQVITGNTANLAVEGFVLAAFGRIRPEFADLTSAFTITAQVEAGLIAQADFNATTALTAQPTKQLGAVIVNCTSSSSLSVDAVAIPSGSVACQVTASTQAQGNRIRFADSTVLGEFTTTADADVIRRLAATLSSNASSSATATRIKQLDADFDAVASELTAINKIGSALIDSAITSSLTVDARVNANGYTGMESTTSLTVVASNVNKTFASNQSATSQMTAQAESGLIGGADLSATSNLTVGVNVIASANISTTSAFTLQATSAPIRDVIALEFAFADAQIDADVIRGLESHSAVVTSVTASLSKLKNAQAALQSQGFVLAIGKVINLAASDIYVVPRDTNTWTIRAEDNTWTVPVENRIYIIKE